MSNAEGLPRVKHTLYIMLKPGKNQIHLEKFGWIECIKIRIRPACRVYWHICKKRCPAIDNLDQVRDNLRSGPVSIDIKRMLQYAHSVEAAFAAGKGKRVHTPDYVALMWMNNCKKYAGNGILDGFDFAGSTPQWNALNATGITLKIEPVCHCIKIRPEDQLIKMVVYELLPAPKIKCAMI